MTTGMRVVRTGSLPVTLLVLVLSVFLVQCQQTKTADVNSSAVVVHEFSPEAAKDAQEYWTEERMREARPMPVPTLSEEEFETLRRLLEAEEIEPIAPTYVSPAAPEYEGDDSPAKQDGSNESAAPAAFKTTKVPKSEFNNSKTPYYRNGKVFFRQGGKDWVCSGASIANRALLTAGHCVFDKDKKEWSTHFQFCPSYNNGCYFNWKWYAKTLYTLKGWAEQGNFRYDLAMVVTTSKLRYYVGTLGWHSEGYTFNDWMAVGYPAEPISGYTFDGRYMWRSHGDKTNSGLTGIIAMDNNMTGGSSGGPWLDPTSWEGHMYFYANGINSFGYDSRPNVMYSPAFGQGFINLYNAVKDQ